MNEAIWFGAGTCERRVTLWARLAGFTEALGMTHVKHDEPMVLIADSFPDEILARDGATFSDQRCYQRLLNMIHHWLVLETLTNNYNNSTVRLVIFVARVSKPLSSTGFCGNLVPHH